MKQSYMKALREIQDICKKETDCSNSCPFYYDGGCLFVLYPKYWEWDKFKIEE